MHAEIDHAAAARLRGIVEPGPVGTTGVVECQICELALGFEADRRGVSVTIY
jgi:hypothetical protein